MDLTKRSASSSNLARVGVDYDDVTATLEKEGIQKFADSFEELLNAIEGKWRELIPA